MNKPFFVFVLLLLLLIIILIVLYNRIILFLTPSCKLDLGCSQPEVAPLGLTVLKTLISCGDF